MKPSSAFSSIAVAFSSPTFLTSWRKRFSPSSFDTASVRNFDAARYMGSWYEIARMPQWFEKDLDHVTATYALEDGKQRITNRGFRSGKEKIATAVGHFADTRDVGAFRISFFRPLYGDYRIIHLSPGYDAMKEAYTAKTLYHATRAFVVTNATYTPQVHHTVCQLGVTLTNTGRSWRPLDDNI